MKLAIYGTGGSGKELYEMIQGFSQLKQRWSEIIFIDDFREEGIYKECRMISFEKFSALMNTEDAEVVIAVGEPEFRKMLYERVKTKNFHLATIISPDARVSESAMLGEGVVIKNDVIISSDAYVGDNTYINSIVVIGHDVKIGMHCQISTFSFIGGSAEIGDNVFIGASACIRDRICVDDNCIISTGAIVLKDVLANKIVMGNPAREIAENIEKRIFK